MQSVELNKSVFSPLMRGNFQVEFFNNFNARTLIIVINKYSAFPLLEEGKFYYRLLSSFYIKTIVFYIKSELFY